MFWYRNVFSFLVSFFLHVRRGILLTLARQQYEKDYDRKHVVFVVIQSAHALHTTRKPLEVCSLNFSHWNEFWRVFNVSRWRKIIAVIYFWKRKYLEKYVKYAENKFDSHVLVNFAIVFATMTVTLISNKYSNRIRSEKTLIFYELTVMSLRMMLESQIYLTKQCQIDWKFNKSVNCNW